MARITRWEPMQDLLELRDEMNRALEGRPLRARLRRYSGEEEGMRGAWLPPVDIRETKDAIEIMAELPGVDAENVDVSVEGNVLTIRGERRQEQVREDETFHRVERSYGMFERSFTLPRSVNAEKVSASYRDGILTVTVPKREEAKPKTVKVQVEKT